MAHQVRVDHFNSFEILDDYGLTCKVRYSCGCEEVLTWEQVDYKDKVMKSPFN